MQRGRPVAARVPLTNLGLVLGLFGLGGPFPAGPQNFLRPNNGLNIGRAAAYTGIAAAVTTLVLIGGGLDLSIGAVMALVGVVAARMLAAGQPLWLTLVASHGVGAAVGIVNGSVVTFVGVNP